MDGALGQFIKFNIVGCTVSLLQLVLANILPLAFDGMTVKLPAFLRPVFNAEVLFDGPSPYVMDGVTTWGFVLPFFLSNFIANIYGYFVNKKATFQGKGSAAGMAVYILILTLLILFSTWFQGVLTASMSGTAVAPFARTIAASAAGWIQVAVLFPLEKYVLFPKRQNKE